MASIALNDEILRMAEKLASAEGRPLERVLEEALRERLTRSSSSPNRSLQLPVFHGTGVRPGVNLDSNAALLEILDEAE